MTELLISSKLRGKPFTWRYGEYVSQGTVASFSKAGDTKKTQWIQQIYGSYAWVVYSNRFASQTFLSPSFPNVKLRELHLYMYKGSPEDDLYAELWSVGADGKPASKITDIGTFLAADVSTTAAWHSLVGLNISLSSSTQYAIVLKSPNTTLYGYYIYHDRNDRYLDGEAYQSTDGGSTWSQGTYYKDMRFKLFFESDPPPEELAWSQSFTVKRSPIAVVRLDIEEGANWSGVTKILVNGQNVGTTLDLADNIPQADNYTVEIYVQGQYSISGTLKKYLYYNKNPITPGDLGYSEAYLLKVSYQVNGSMLEINDDPDMQLQGDAGIEDTFTDILVPWRSLKWITGRGRVLALGIE